MKGLFILNRISIVKIKKKRSIIKLKIAAYTVLIKNEHLTRIIVNYPLQL